jgi:ligand-binding SRPBCC domain-containing protein
MNLESIHTLCHLPVSVPEAWDFFSDPRNLERITPPSLGIRITSGIPPRMHPGMIVTYAIRVYPGIPVRWVTEITHVLEPRLFVDEQRFGPYRFWHHQHHFSEVEGGTAVEDLVHYALPFGPAGRMFGGGFVRRQLDEIFSFRRQFLEHAFGRLTIPHPGRSVAPLSRSFTPP